MRQLLLFLLFLACDTVEEKYLFDENDAEYSRAQQLAINECTSGNAIFSSLETARDFANSQFEQDDIFKIVQDDNEATTIYVKITNIGASDMTLVYSSDEEKYRKVLTFTETNHQDIENFLRLGSCDSDYEDFFKPSNLDSSTTLSFVWDKTTTIISDDEDDSDDKPEAYRDVTETLSVSTLYPLFFYYYNGSKSQKYVLNDGDEEKIKESKISITEVTSAEECDEDGTSDNEFCKFGSLDTSSFPTCTLTVDDDAYLVRSHDKKVIEISGTDCELLSSAGI